MAAPKPTIFPEWDNNGTNMAEPDVTRKADGWLVPGGVPEKPPVEYDNFMKRNSSDWINAINESGILLHDLVTTYPDKALVMGSNGVIYRSQQASNVNHEPVGDSGTWWKQAFNEVSDIGAVVKVADVKASGTAGGAFTSGAWQTRTLNTEVVNDVTGASLAANQITLPAGTYITKGRAPAVAVNAHALGLYNVTDAQFEPGTSGDTAYNTSGTTSTTHAFVDGKFTIASTKVFELQHQCQTTKLTDGFGLAASFSGRSEVYATLEFVKVG